LLSVYICHTTFERFANGRRLDKRLHWPLACVNLYVVGRQIIRRHNHHNNVCIVLQN